LLPQVDIGTALGIDKTVLTYLLDKQPSRLGILRRTEL